MNNSVSEQQRCLPGPRGDGIQVLHMRKASIFSTDGLALSSVDKSCFVPMAWDPCLKQKAFMVEINPTLDQLILGLELVK